MTTAEGAFVIVAEFEVRPEAIDAFLDAAIADASASVANEPGCRQFHVTRSSEQPNRVLLYGSTTALRPSMPISRCRT